MITEALQRWGAFCLTWGMRWKLIILFFVISATSFAQEKKTWIGDTSIVKTSIVEGDTSYFVKYELRSGMWMIYYDSKFKNRARYIKADIYKSVDTAWFRNGKVKSWSHPVDSCGNCWRSKEWYVEGGLKMEMYFSNDTCYELHYYRSGAISEKNLSMRDSPNDQHVTWHYSAQYYENGQLTFLPGDPNLRKPQPYITYYESGQKMEESTRLMPYLCSEFTSWYSNGQLHVKGQYPPCPLETQWKAPDKIGTWSYYNESGKLIKEEFYEEGKLVRTMEY